jgi:hypothetical protein
MAIDDGSVRCCRRLSICVVEARASGFVRGGGVARGVDEVEVVGVQSGVFDGFFERLVEAVAYVGVEDLAVPSI